MSVSRRYVRKGSPVPSPALSLNRKPVPWSSALYWQGPSLGFDAGADGDRTMMLVYSLPDKRAIFRRFIGIDGSAYFVGGLGFTALGTEGIMVVPIRTGVGARLGINVNYLKFTQQATWNPF